MRIARYGWVFLAVSAACGEDTRADDATTIDAPTITAVESSSAPPSTDTGDRFDVGKGSATEPAEGEGGECAPPVDADATLTGTVYAPNLEIPISGALVYLTTGAVEPVPDGAFCSACVELTCDKPFVLTEPDGSFELPATAGLGQKLVVQKGEFLHVVDFDVVAGDNPVPAEQSNLPGRWDPDAGMWIPRIAVYRTDPDRVYNVLAKFGLGEVSGNGELVPGTEQFTLISDSDQGAFMDDFLGMTDYHIVFVPCAATKDWFTAPTVAPLRAQNIRDFVAAGGKWYATDHSNEYIEAPFSDYQEFHAPGMPDIQPAYDVVGTVLDADMLAWLQALPPALEDIGGGNPTLNQLPSVELQLNYSGIEAIPPVIVQDDEGDDVDVGHKAWVEGPCTSCSDPSRVRPMAISGQWGCGRMMYSTFENSSVAHDGLNPQELILLYMILEITVCHDSPPPPPPPVG
ncbi:MAG: hypothetical protein IAG13_12810 [Deltaproteobacteria bacterium]|nr:hypothetical protein [Nannocystaceae bacterium]